VHKKSKGLA